jgi:hypothetical protein
VQLFSLEQDCKQQQANGLYWFRTVDHKRDDEIEQFIVIHQSLAAEQQQQQQQRQLKFVADSSSQHISSQQQPHLPNKPTPIQQQQ